MTNSKNSSMSGKMIIVAAPSGAGKSSFVERVCTEEPRLFDTITYTTRPMRVGESQGKPYYFVSTKEFEQKISEDFFVEWAKVHTNLYGTPHEQILGAWEKNFAVIMDVDVQGVKTFTQKFPSAKTIFILPPSMEELKKRLKKRDGDKIQDLEVRMKNAENEIKEAQHFDYQLVNDDFEVSYQKFKKIVEDILNS